MRSFIVGTAGHIDHGKSTLVRALTGTDPDRLKAEKERGITIDLGFAHTTLGGGVTASFIDVPGHEKFVRHMLAGIGGIDAALLVVSAIEGVMPQTREHFEICRLLEIPRGVVAITKVDLAEPSATERAEASVAGLVRGSFLASAPRIRVSAVSGAGIDELRGALRALSSASPLRSDRGILRLPIDRVFTLKGFGTVVTGTLMGGSIATGDDVVVLPEGRSVRVRGIQVHGASVDRARAGERTAVNLADVAHTELSRGQVIARRGELRTTDRAIAAIEPLDGVDLRHGERVHAFAASAEGRARVRMSEGVAVRGTVAELRFETPFILARGDRLILRSYSPVRTVAGARILDPVARAFRRSLMSALASRRMESDALAFARWIREAGDSGLATAEIAAMAGVPVESVREGLSGASGLVNLETAGVTRWLDAEVLTGLGDRLIRAVAEKHEADPLAPGVSREAALQRAAPRLERAVFDALVHRLSENGRIVAEADLLRLPTHRVRLTSPEEKARDLVSKAIEGAGLEGVGLKDLHQRIGVDRAACEAAVRVLVQSRFAERIGDGLLMATSSLLAFRETVRQKFRAGSQVDVAEIKALTGLTRKYVIPLLEWLDRERVTRRVGAARIVL